MTRLDRDRLFRPRTMAVLDALAGEGHQALLVGGCVRDALLAEPVNDIDIATDARPAQVVELAERAGLKPVATNASYGAVTVISKGVPHQVTTFRRDVETFGRRAVIAFSSEVAEDARRRDFTMNALYAGSDGTVIDPLGCIADLVARRVRFIESADVRIREDYLRILRFFRFHAWYGDRAKGIDADGLAACAANLDGLDMLSKERVGKEVLKLLAACDPAFAVADMASCGCLDRILPGSSPDALPRLVELEAKAGADPNPVRRLAVIGGRDPARNLRLSKAVSRRLDVIRESAETVADPAELAYRLGRGIALDAALARQALLGDPLPPSLDADLDRGAGARFPLSGRDLVGVPSGPELGRRLRSLEAAWIASGYTLDRTALLDAVHADTVG